MFENFTYIDYIAAYCMIWAATAFLVTKWEQFCDPEISETKLVIKAALIGIFWWLFIAVILICWMIFLFVKFVLDPIMVVSELVMDKINKILPKYMRRGAK